MTLVMANLTLSFGWNDYFSALLGSRYKNILYLTYLISLLEFLFYTFSIVICVVSQQMDRVLELFTLVSA